MKQLNKSVLALSLVFLLTSCTSNEVSETEEIHYKPVRTEVLQNESIKSELMYAGRLEPENTVSVLPKMQGKVKKANFEIGSYVTEGEVLFELDKTDIENQIVTLEAQYNQAQQGIVSAQNSANSVTGGQFQSQVLQQDNAIESYQKQIENAEVSLKNANLGIENAKIGINNSEVAIENAEKALDNAISSYETAKDNHDKTKFLYEQGVVAEIEYKGTKTALEQAEYGKTQAENAVEQAKIGKTTAEKGLEQANNALEQAKVGLSQAEQSLEQAKKGKNILVNEIASDNQTSANLAVNSARAGADIIQTQIDTARETLNDATVKAPISGYISAKNVKATEYASMQVASYVIVKTDRLNVSVSVSEVLISNIYAGQEVDVYIKSLGETPIKATIKTISPTADQTSTYPVIMEIENSDNKIKSGMFAEVRFVKEKSKNSIVVPINAVIENYEETFVYIVDGDSAKKTIVEIGINNGKDVEITSGLAVGDELIVEGQTYLSDGDKINIIANTEED